MAVASSISSLDMDWNKDMGGTSIWCQNQLFLIVSIVHGTMLECVFQSIRSKKSLLSASALYGGALEELFKILMSGLTLSAKRLEAHILPVLLSHFAWSLLPFLFYHRIMKQADLHQLWPPPHLPPHKPWTSQSPELKKVNTQSLIFSTVTSRGKNGLRDYKCVKFPIKRQRLGF